MTEAQRIKNFVPLDFLYAESVTFVIVTETIYSGVMRIEWSSQALREWENTTRYIYNEFGRKAAEEFEKNIARWENRIAVNLELAHQEPLLKDRSRLYRGLVVSKHSKLI